MTLLLFRFLAVFLLEAHYSVFGAKSTRTHTNHSYLLPISTAFSLPNFWLIVCPLQHYKNITSATTTSTLTHKFPLEIPLLPLPSAILHALFFTSLPLLNIFGKFSRSTLQLLL